MVQHERALSKPGTGVFLFRPTITNCGLWLSAFFSSSQKPISNVCAFVADITPQLVRSTVGGKKDSYPRCTGGSGLVGIKVLYYSCFKITTLIYQYLSEQNW